MISFGGGGSSESYSSKSEPVRVPLWNTQQAKLFKLLSPKLSAGLDKEVAAYPKQMYAPLNEYEKGFLDSTQGLAKSMADYRQKLGQPAYTISPEITEQYFQDVIRKPALRQWEETVLPTIKESYAGPGYWGSARAEAEVEASKDLAENLGSERAKLYYADEQARREAAEAAANRSAQGTQASIEAEANLLGTAGAYARQVDQERVLADMQRWLMGETVDGVKPEVYNPFIQLIFQALGLTPYGIGTKSQSEGSSSGFSMNFGFTGKK